MVYDGKSHESLWELGVALFQETPCVMWYGCDLIYWNWFTCKNHAKSHGKTLIISHPHIQVEGRKAEPEARPQESEPRRSRSRLERKITMSPCHGRTHYFNGCQFSIAKCESLPAGRWNVRLVLVHLCEYGYPTWSDTRPDFAWRSGPVHLVSTHATWQRHLEGSTTSWRVDGSVSCQFLHQAVADSLKSQARKLKPKRLKKPSVPKKSRWKQSKPWAFEIMCKDYSWLSLPWKSRKVTTGIWSSIKFHAALISFPSWEFVWCRAFLWKPCFIIVSS